MAFLGQPRIALFLLMFSVILPQGMTFNFGTNAFLDNTLLTCMIPGPNRESVPEEIRRLSFQPGPQGTVWLPRESGFDLPGFEPLDTGALTTFLSGNLQATDLIFISFIEPNTNPPLAQTNIPVIGSGGRFETIFPTDPPVMPDLETTDPDDRGAIMRFITRFGLGSCVPTAAWTKLPDTFFPRYYAGSMCANPEGTTSCSFPEGLQCEPDISTPNRMAYTRVLRWDCCWSFLDGEWKWQCGWRRVEIPIVVDCTCGCQPLLPS